MKKVFIKTPQTAGSFPINRLVQNLSYTDKDIGLEIECEGNFFRKDSILPTPWKYTKDGSLRGQDNAEYIFKSPQKFEDVGPALDTLWKMFEKDGTVLDESNRTSVHVHMNAQSFYLNRLCSFVALYVCVEELLTEWCGDHRVGNLFCLRTKDAPAILSTIKKFFVSEGQSTIDDHYHYAGLNAAALFKFGSIEIRSLRGCTDPETIKTWVGILERIYKMSADYEDPRDICHSYSGNGYVAFLQNILGPYYNTVRQGINYTEAEVSDAALSGMRLAQDLCYCRDWSKYVKLDPRMDPFGRRSAKEVAEVATPSPSLSPAPTPSEPSWMNFTYSAVASTDDDVDVDVDIPEDWFDDYEPEE